jgi:hypothetical protein
VLTYEGFSRPLANVIFGFSIVIYDVSMMSLREEILHVVHI